MVRYWCRSGLGVSWFTDGPVRRKDGAAMRAFRDRLSYANVVATLALFVAVGGGAWAASGGLIGSNGVIHGCVPNKGGTLTIVAPGQKCRRGLTAISFNRQGRLGLRGAAGAQGGQ